MKNKFHRLVAIHILSGLLLVALSGCDELNKRAAPKTPLPAAAVSEPKNDLDTTYEQLLRKRLDAEKRIFEAMELYSAISKKVREQRTLLRGYLGEMSVEEAIDVFNKNKPNDIPSDLRIAYSCWRTLLPDETLRVKIINWLDQQQVSGILEELDIKIKDIENYIQLGKIIDQKDQREIDRLLSVSLTDWNNANDVNEKMLEQQAIDNIKAGLINL